MSQVSSTLVSVITGYYNRGHLLDRTIESVLAQTHKNIELIIFDDCSTDDTRERLSRYQSLNDPRIKVLLHERNKGFVQGMIDAVSIAKGDYIAVQSSGDISLPGRIAAQASALDQDPEVGVVGCHYENVIEQHGIVRLRQPNADGTTFESLLKGNVFSHGEVMFRRTHYDAAGGYRSEFKYCQDYDLWLRMIKVCRFHTVPELHFKRFVQFDGVSYAPSKAIVQARYFLLCQRLPYMSEEQQAEALKALKEGRIKDIIPQSDPALQKRVFRACLRSIVWGEVDSAIAYSENLDSTAGRLAVKVVGRSLQTKAFALPRRALFKALGVRQG